MKKIICLFLALSLTIPLLASCGGSTEETGRESMNSEEMTSEAITETITEAVTDSVVQAPEFTVSENTLDCTVGCGFAAVLDVGSREILYQKGGLKTKMYPASTTKILTSIIVTNLCTLDETHTVGDELDLVSADSSVAGLKKGDLFTVEDLMYALLLPSGNDAAYALAACAGKHLSDREVSNKAAVSLFIKEMNRFGNEVLGLENSNFTCPDGYPDDNHYTCLSDMLKMAYTAHENDVIMKFMGTQSATVNVKRGNQTRRLSFTNTNLLLNSGSSCYYSYATGMKTGTTRAAGKCLVSSAKRGEREVIVCVFKAEDDRYIDTLALLKAALK